MNEGKSSGLSNKQPSRKILEKKQGSFFLGFKDVSPC